MGQASNAPAREPSMEEILASIRRIIEDSDTGRRPGDEAAHDPADEPTALVEAESAADAYDQADDVGPEVEAFRSEFTEPQPPAAAPAYAPARETAPEPAPETVSETVRDTAPAGPAAYSSGAHSAQNEQASPNGFDHHHEEPEFAAADEAAPVEPTQMAAAQSRGDSAAARGGIISEFAGRQVAAAFEELSEAFSASRKRSYDEIAEEIMRPMLQDWLDNNLPLLVERLVREEIERVARGGAG